MKIPTPLILMFRHVVTFCLLSVFLCSSGCRMCGTPYDCRISGYVDRFDDYRGFNPMYRAGSVFSGGDMVIGNVCYAGNRGDLYNNAGNYGFTVPATTVRPRPSTGDTNQIPGQHPIGTPDRAPLNDLLEGVPTIEELINQPRGTAPNSESITPPPRQRVIPSPSEDPYIETFPLSPNDEMITPPSTVPSNMDADITLEELRRLDPSVQDVQIISIEDAAVDTIIR